MATDMDKPRILVVGGGYVGMYAALRLQKKLRPGEATVTVVDPQPNMTYQPFLPEAAAGSIELATSWCRSGGCCVARRCSPRRWRAWIMIGGPRCSAPTKGRRSSFPTTCW